MANSAEQQHAVIIVGGGPVGLSCSILLSLRNIPHILFERHLGTSIHPKACGINQRTCEIFRVMGIEDEVYKNGCPPEIAGRTAWYTGLGPGDHEIYSRDAWGGGKYAEEYAKHSPSRYCILPQIRLEPILLRRARELNPDGIMYNHEVIKVSNSPDCASITVKDRESRGVQHFTARYALICDGGRSLTNHLGIAWEGQKDLFEMVTAHFRAPLRDLHPDPSNFITWFSKPEMGGSTRTGYLYQTGPWPLQKPEEEEWVFACGLTEEDPKSFDQDTMVTRLRKTLGFPDLKVEMLSLSHWNVNSIYAEKWRLGRVFLVGDSAHRIPPWGALGMNSGVQDAQNLIWKLQLALSDDARYSELLDTYQEERLEVGRRVGLTSLHNARSHSNVIDAALGINTSQTPEQNRQAFASFIDGSHPDHEGKRAAIERAQKVLDTEFKAPGYEVGWFYPSADINHEGGETHGGQQTVDGKLEHEFYHQSTIPGHHLPHVWLEKGGKRKAIRDLLSLDKLTLFAQQVSSEITLSDALVRTVLINADEWIDVDGEWCRIRGVDDNGGVLVRPDGIVAWRGSLKTFDSSGWAALLDTILCYRRSGAD